MKLLFLISATFGLFLGISIAYSINFSTQIFLVSGVLFLINFLIYKFSKRSFGVYKSETPIFLSILFLFISLGILFSQYNIAKDISQKNNFEEYISQSENYNGVIIEIKNTEKSQQLIINLKDTDFKIKVITGKFPEYHIGQILNINGKIEKENVLLPEVSQKYNESFDLSQYDSLKDIKGEITFPKIEVIGESEKFLYKFQNLKARFVNILDEVAPRAVSSLGAGTTLGDGSLFAKNEIENFRVSGLSHIIVLSGFNITILIFFLGIIFLKLRLRLTARIILTIFSIIIFIIFVGANASIVRAGIMGIILLMATIYGRQYLAKQALFISAFLMIILNPKIAPLDISFHLSFLATFAILYLVPIFDKYKFFQKENHKSKFLQNILEILKVTLAVQIFVLPYIAFTFGKVSLFGIIANILVVPFVPFIMAMTLFIIFFSLISTSLATFFSYISFIVSKYVFMVSEFISKISFSSIELKFNLLSMIIIYSLLIFFIYFEKKRIKIKKYLENNQ